MHILNIDVWSLMTKQVGLFYQYLRIFLLFVYHLVLCMCVCVYRLTILMLLG